MLVKNARRRERATGRRQGCRSVERMFSRPMPRIQREPAFGAGISAAQAQGRQLVHADLSGALLAPSATTGTADSAAKLRLSHDKQWVCREAAPQSSSPHEVPPPPRPPSINVGDDTALPPSSPSSQCWKLNAVAGDQWLRSRLGQMLILCCDNID